ncbi:hypothetical protein Nepgr_029032 [Nepenthes gracilis]|uniref:LOB domain-containing protein n=1 Tax=Nepenthes gracilis TaxID=150966 RepID=A0AAD3TDA7_NEPGR|nr:hypothetical protein Nepgr_029032 [Nepenthes gracilis]
MRMSCNGCRVLRKGCNENCIIRPCLQWIKSPESQANATVFLAKFYGRAGLMNLINAGPENLRPAIFRSMLYEACGRIVNPIYGSVGLLWSGSWQLCQSAVDAVLRGLPITTIAPDAATVTVPPIKDYDIRHVMRDENFAAASGELHRVKTRPRFKRCGAVNAKASKAVNAPVTMVPADETILPCGGGSMSHDSSTSHVTADESMVSLETSEAAATVAGAEPEVALKTVSDDEPEDGELELELTLGYHPVSRLQ